MLRGLFVRKIGFVLLLLIACTGYSSDVLSSDPKPTVDGTQSFELGSTTKNNVIELFGEPSATFDNEATFAYIADESAIRKLIHAVSALSLVVASGAGAATGNPYFPPVPGTWHFLILNFDEQDVLTDYQHEFSDHLESDCIRAGWCVKHGRVFRLADESEDTVAKQFAVANHACGIYIFGNFEPEMALYLNGIDKGGVFSSSYFQLWTTDPGMHEIEIRPQPGLQTWDWSGVPRVTFNCLAGEAVFVRLSGLENVRLSHRRDNNRQRKQIRKRALILSGPALHNLRSE